MLMAQKNIPFTQYEAAVLLDAYLTYREKGGSLSSVARKVSYDLRRMAENEGRNADDTFRSVKGITTQLLRMESAEVGHTVKGNAAPRLFAEMVALYRNDPAAYRDLLEEARRMIAGKGFSEKESIRSDRAGFEELQQDIPVPDKCPEPVSAHEAMQGNDLKNKIVALLPDAFPNGMRFNSLIDQNNLRRAYSAFYSGETIPDGLDLSTILLSVGILSGGKVFILSPAQQEELRSRVYCYFAEGYQIIYYSEFLAHGADFLESCHVYEETRLHDICKTVLPSFVNGEDHLAFREDAAVEDDIILAFGDHPARSVSELQENCFYLPADVIRKALSSSGKFVKVQKESYVRVDRVSFDPPEIADAMDHASAEIAQNGYFLFSRIRLERSCERNPELSGSTVREAMYLRYFAGRYQRNGVFLCEKGKAVSNASLIEAYCRESDQLTLNELLRFEQELTGRSSQTAFHVACRTMIRVDRDHFVSDSQLSFAVEQIDHALDLFARRRVISVMGVTSFSSFPDVGEYEWNHYLLESYVRRFSKRYRIDGGPAQTSCAGSICPFDMHYNSYEDLLAFVVLQDSVPLNEAKIGDYLVAHKFLLRRGTTVNRVFRKAVRLKEQREISGV